MHLYRLCSTPKCPIPESHKVIELTKRTCLHMLLQLNLGAVYNLLATLLPNNS